MGIAYSIFLVWAVLYKYGVPFIGDGAERTINLLPFNENSYVKLHFADFS